MDRTRHRQIRFGVELELGPRAESTEDAVINTGSTAALIGCSSSETVGSISLGSNDALLIESGTTFFATNGTGPNVNNGTINVYDATLEISNAGFGNTTTFDNAGSVQLASVSAGAPSTLLFGNVGGLVNLTGSGSIEMSIGGPDTSNIITANAFGEAGDTLSYVVNKSEIISGTGTIGGGWLQFTNDFIIDTNNNTSCSGGILNIQGGWDSSFTNNDLVEAGNGGTLIFGQDGLPDGIYNGGVIALDSSGTITKMEIAGSVDFWWSGSISLEGSNPADDQILSDGKAATLNLDGSTLLGAGLVGDTHLTLNNDAGATIDADDSGKSLTLNTGSNTITNQGKLEADGGDLRIKSSVANSGTIEALDGGLVNVDAAISGSGAVDIAQNSTLDTDSTIAGNVTFTGTGAQLIIDNGYANGGIGGQVVDAQSGDSVDFKAVAYSSAVQALWNQISSTGGTLSLVNGSSTLATLNLAGTYATGNFSVSNDSGTAQVKLG